MLYPLLRPLLFALDPETAHEAAFAGPRCRRRVRRRAVGRAAGTRRRRSKSWASRSPTVSASPPASTRMLRTSTVSPRWASASSNAAPSRRGRSRAIRSRACFACLEAEALINRLGFNNDGVERFLRNVARARFASARGGILGLNIGKNFDTPNARAIDDYVACLTAVYAHASYVTVNISSPNTKGLRDLQDRRCARAPAGHAQGGAGATRAGPRQVHAAGGQDRARPDHRRPAAHRAVA